MMFITKVKIVAAVTLAVAVAAAGVGTWSHTTRAGDEPIPSTRKLSKESELLLKKRITEETPIVVKGTLKENPNVGTSIVVEGTLQKEGIAWGEAVHGLQAGLAFRRGDQETYEVGQSVTFVVYLRNVSAKKINLSHIEPLFEERMADVRDAEGRRLAVATDGLIELGEVPLLHRTVEAGQRITLGYPWFRIRRSGFRGEVLGPTCYAMPGRYKVGYTGASLRLEDGKDIRLGTKQVELVINKRETAKGDGAGKKAPTAEKPILGAIGIAEKTPLYYSLSRFVQIPFTIAPENLDKTSKLILWASVDHGQTWRLVDSQPAIKRSFQFHAFNDGMHWFIVQIVDKQGRSEPADPSRAKPSIRICVDTTPPVVTLQARSDKNKIHLTWTSEDDNLEDKPVRQIQCADEKEGPWDVPILSGPLPKSGSITWDLPELPPGISRPPDMFFRIQVRDKAGNDGYAIAYIKLE